MNAVFESYCTRTKVDLSDWCNGEDKYIVLREPNVGEMKVIFEIQKVASNLNDDGSNMGEMADVFEKAGKHLNLLIVEHNFYDKNKCDEKIPVKDVAEFIMSKFDLMSYVMHELVKNVSLKNGSNGKSRS